MSKRYYCLICILLFLASCISCSSSKKGDIIGDINCPIIDTLSNSLKASEIKKVNIFFDASGSMKAFMPSSKESSELQILIPDVISHLKTEFPNSVNFYPIYDTSSKLKSIDLITAENNILYSKFPQMAGDTYLPKMFESIYKGFLEKETVNIFISDCIYSPNSKEKKQIDQTTKEIREPIQPFTKEYFTTTYCLFSKYNKIENSPYYIYIIGTPENNHVIEKIVEKTIITNGQKFEQTNFGLKYKEPYYSILPYTDNMPKWLSNPCTNLNGAFANIVTQNWTPGVDSLKFWIGINLNDFPKYATTNGYLDSNIVLSIKSGKAKILSISKNKPEGLNTDDNEIANKSTHFIHLLINQLDENENSVQISLKYSTPNWISDYNQNISETNGQKTFGLKKLMTGFYDAYYTDVNPLFFRNINISINKQ